MEEKQILTEIQKGSIEAFKEFYNRYSIEMHQLAFSFLKDGKDAEDVVQDSFIAVLNKYDSWSHIQDLRHYTYRIVQNQCLAKLRRNESLAKKENDYSYYQISSTKGVTAPDVIISINRRESKCKIDWLFSFLTPQRKRAVELVYLEGKSYNEAATIMGIGIESIRTHLRLARDILKNNLVSFVYFLSFYMINR